MIPPNWRQDENKGMIRSNDGRWMQPERPKLDDHPEDMHHHLTQLEIEFHPYLEALAGFFKYKN
ncbi:Phospholipase A1-Igamma1 [Spatholobus suberectus]|nr:Phospholipase A1-Igamma1 [Spatholobus suberectus]